MLKLLVKLLLVAAIVFTAGTITVYAATSFQDDFNGSSLDTNKWRVADGGAGDTYSVHDGVIEMIGGGTNTPPGLQLDSNSGSPSTFNLSGTTPVKVEFRVKFIGDPGNLSGTEWGFKNLSNDFNTGKSASFVYRSSLNPNEINEKIADGTSQWFSALDKSGYDFQKFSTYAIEYDPSEPNTYIFRINGMQKYKGTNTGSPLGSLPIYLQVLDDLRYQIDWVKVTNTTDNTIDGNITGIVYDNDSITPVSGATVTTDTGVTATTDANGYYMLSVPAGEYTVTVSKTGYTPRSEKVSVAAYADVRQDLYFPYTNLDLVSGGVANADIVVGTGATWIENHAASELQKYIQQMSGVTLPIVTGSTKSQQILIGRPETNPAINSLVTSGKLKVSVDYPGLDGFIVRALYDSGVKYLVLTGSMDRSSLYATYDLLESLLKCGFFWDGENVPSLSTVTVPIMEKVSRPYFEDRQYNQGCTFSYTEMFWNLDDWKRELDWCAKKKQNIIMIPVHTPTRNTTQDDQYHIQLYKDVYAYARQLGMRTILPAGSNMTVAQIQDLINTYGTDHIYNADPNPEGTWSGTPAQITAMIRQSAIDTHNKIKAADSQGIWFASGWAFYYDPVNWTYDNLKTFMDNVGTHLWDDFSGDLSKWVDTTNASISNGELTVTNNEVMRSASGGTSWTNYTFETDVKITSNSAGLAFRSIDSDNYYMWQLNANTSMLRPHKKVNGVWTVIKEVSTPIALNTTYHVKIEANGSTIKTYIDGNLVDTTIDTTFSSGKVGFREGSTFESAVFDNVSIVSIPSGDEFYVTDTWADNFAIYKKYNYFDGKKWGFSVLQTLGKMQEMHGDMEYVVNAVNAVTNDPKTDNGKLFYINPESVHHNNIFYDLMTRLSWDPRGVDLNNFIGDFSTRRYGDSAASVAMSRSWKILKDTVYRKNYWTTPPFEYSSASTAMLNDEYIEQNLLDCLDFPYSSGEALRNGLSVKTSLSGNTLYQNDMVDMARQYIFDYYNSHYVKMLQAYQKGDAAFFDQLNACRLARSALERVLYSRPDYWVRYDLDKGNAVYGNFEQLESMGSSSLFATPLGSSMETYVRHWWLGRGNNDYARTDTRYELFKIKYSPSAAYFEDWLEQQFYNGKKDINDTDVTTLSNEYEVIRSNWADNPVPNYSPSTESMIDAVSGAYDSLPPLTNGEFFPVKGRNVSVGDITGYTLDVGNTAVWSIENAAGNSGDSSGMSVTASNGYVNLDDLNSSVSDAYFHLDIPSLNLSQYPILALKWKQDWLNAGMTVWVRWQDSNGNSKRSMVSIPSSNGYEWTDVNVDLERILSLKDTGTPARILGIDIGNFWNQNYQLDLAELKIKSRNPVLSPKYEAENASLSGGAVINTNHTGYSGTGFVDAYSTVGATTTFTVNVASAGSYNVALRYANGTTGAQTVSIYVNGTKTKQTSLPNLVNWDTWADRSETLWLGAGSNTIAYKYDAGDTGGVNLDYITLTNRFEAENASLTGGAAANTNYSCYSGTGYVGGYGISGTATTFTVNAASAGTYDVALRYANATGSAQTLSIYVNDTKIRQVSLPNLANWDTWGDKSAILILNAGDNTIAYKYDTGDTGNVNIDYITATTPSVSLVKNGDFEWGTVNWSLHDAGAGWGVTGTDKFSGSNSLYIDGNDGIAAVISDPIYVSPGSYYIASCFAKGNHMIYVREFDKNGVQVAEHGPGQETTTDWKYQAHGFVTAPDTQYIRVALYTYANSRAYFDYVQVNGDWTPVNGSLATNGDFESGTVNWSLHDAGAGWGVTGTDKFSGSNSLYIDGNDGIAAVISDPIYVNPGGYYIVSCFAKGNHMIYVREFNKNGVQVAEHGPGQETTTDWKYQAHGFVTAPDTQYIKVALYTYANSRAYFDYVQVNGDWTPVDGSLATNGDFESGSANWSLLDPGAGWGVTGTDKFRGSYSLYIDGDGTPAAVQNDSISVNPNTEYIISCFAKGNHNTYVREYDSLGRLVTEHGSSAETTADWKYQTHKFITSASTQYIRISLYTYGGSGERAYFDYVQCRQN